MSDSVTSVDVEDVLSSIRRLVTDTNSDARPAPKPSVEPEPKALGEKTADEKTSDALLLTSALRVHSKPENAGEATDDTEAAADLPNLREAIAAADSDDAEDSGADNGGDDAAQDWPTSATDDYYEDDEPEDVAPVIDFIRHDRAADGGAATAATATPEQDASAEFEGDHFEIVQEQAEEEPASDDPQDSDEAPDWTPTFVHTDTPRDDAAEEASEPEQDASEDAQLPSWIETGHAEISEAEVATHNEDEAHAADNDAAAEWPTDAHHETAEEPQSEDLSDLSEQEPEVVFASAAAASVFAADDPEPETAAVDPDLGNFEDDVIDEDALRDLVAEIVREELTGELGERITRNVRKLVRREIHRALVTREFE